MIRFGATYDPEKTTLKQAVARTGLTLKRVGRIRSHWAVLLNGDTVVWEGCDLDAFDALKALTSLKPGVH